MTFLQPFVLWGLPLILLPVIIHLINRMRHRPQPWAAMRFLISASRASTSHAKLRQFLILLFRVLAVLMLLFFLARPLAGGWMGWMLSSAPDVIIIALDRSASMETAAAPGVTRREQALKLISQAAREFEGASRLVLIDSALKTPQELSSADTLRGSSLSAATDTAADLPALLQSAYNYLMENRAGSAELWIASDLQRSNWQPDDARFRNSVEQLSSLPGKLRVRLLALNQPGEANASVSLHDVARRAAGSGSELQFVLDFQSTEGKSAPIPLSVSLNGAESQTQVTLDSQSLRWRYRADIGTGASSGWGRFQLPADASLRDNTAYFVYGPPAPNRVTVVSADAGIGRLLALAAAAIAGESSAVQPLSIPEAAAAKLDDRSLILWQGALPTGAMAARLQAFIEEGGVALFLPPGEADTGAFAGIGWGGTQAVDADEGFHIGRWDEDQGPLARSDEGFSLPLRQTDFLQRQVITGDKTVMASFNDGEPLLARQVVGKGQVYFCATLPASDWSSLADGPVLIPMLQRLMQAGGQRLQPALRMDCGELSLADQQRQWSSVDSAENKNIQLHAGVYRSGDRWVAVNRPAAEDDPEVADANEIKELFSGVSFQMLHEQQAGGDRLQGEIWRFFLFGMLLFLVGESLLILPGRGASGEPGNRSSTRENLQRSPEPSVK